jgi:hypothetical protein
MTQKSNFPSKMIYRNLSYIILLGLLLKIGFAVETASLINNPSLHITNDAEGLIHRFPSKRGGEV